MRKKIFQTLAVTSLGYLGLISCNTHVSAWTGFPPVYFNQNECQLICNGKANLGDIQKRVLEECNKINPNGNYKNNIGDRISRNMGKLNNENSVPACSTNCLRSIAATCD